MERTPESEDENAAPNVPDNRENGPEERLTPRFVQPPRRRGGPYWTCSAQN